MEAVIYARVSSTDESQSYERQIEDLKSLGEFKKLEIVEVFAEKISGFKKGLDERKEFNKMLAYIEQNNIKHILISELSRLSRRYIDSVNFIHDCTSKGICIHIHKEGLSTLKEDGTENSTVRMLMGIFSDIAEQEAETLSFRIKSGKKYSASQGGGFNQKIYGYDKGDDGKPVINEQQAVLVRKMFKMILQGTGTRTIANYLNDNYETKGWKPSTVHSILRNSFFCGKRIASGLTIEVPAIVDEKTFDAAQEFINKRKRYAGGVGTNVNPFASYIRCKCGATMNQIIIKSSNINFYRCASKCGVQSVNRDFLIKEVKRVVERNAKLTKDKDVRNRLVQKIAADSSNISTHENRIRQVKMMSDTNYERWLEGKVDENKYKRYEKKFDVEIEKLTNDIKILKESNTAIKTSLESEIMHYSDDLSVFKSQLLKSIEWIEIDKELAIVKIKGWARQTILIYRGSELQKYNNRMKRIESKLTIHKE